MTEHTKLTQGQIAEIAACWAGVQYTAPQTDDEGYLHVSLDTSHSVGWDIEGARGCCKAHLVRIAAAPADIAALLSHVAALEAELAAAQTTVQSAHDSAAHNAAEAQRAGKLLCEADAENKRLRKVALKASDLLTVVKTPGDHRFDAGMIWAQDELASALEALDGDAADD